MCGRILKPKPCDGPLLGSQCSEVRVGPEPHSSSPPPGMNTSGLWDSRVHASHCILLRWGPAYEASGGGAIQLTDSSMRSRSGVRTAEGHMTWSPMELVSFGQGWCMTGHQPAGLGLSSTLGAKWHVGAWPRQTDATPQ